MTPFDRWSDRDIIDLVDAYPLALVVGGSGTGRTTPLPMLIEADADGRPVSLLGHFAKRNPQVDQVRADPRTLFLFMGPHGYISPELVTTTRDWGPTWNYAFAAITADIAFDEALNEEAITRLLTKMEQGRRKPWSPAEMGDRYSQLKAHVIAFRATIVEIDARFKLGQDERPEVLSDIIDGTGDALAQWMRRFNAERR